MGNSGISFDATNKQFHLYNDRISYVMKVLRDGQLGQLYFGARLPETRDYGYFVDTEHYRPTTAYVFDNEYGFSREHLRQEYPSYGTTDFREGAVEIAQKDGSHITDFRYVSHEIAAGKPKLAGLPATYVESADEAETLKITLRDEKIGVDLVLSYTIFRDFDAIARNAYFVNHGQETVDLTRAMSLSLDLPDADYDCGKG